MKGRGSESRPSSPAEPFVFTAVLLVLALVLLAASFRLGSSGLVPRVVAIPLSLLLCYRLIREIGDLRPAAAHEKAATGEAVADEMGAIMWLLALPALSTVLGFVVGPALYVLAWMRFRAAERWGVAVATAAVTAAAIVGLFTMLLGTQLPAGVFGFLLDQ